MDVIHRQKKNILCYLQYVKSLKAISNTQSPVIIRKTAKKFNFYSNLEPFDRKPYIPLRKIARINTDSWPTACRNNTERLSKIFLILTFFVNTQRKQNHCFQELNIILPIALRYFFKAKQASTNACFLVSQSVSYLVSSLVLYLLKFISL